ncbi:hypothetical protein G5B19_22345 [Enterocloster clostridioformis]|nr:hypothetical protein [Enterocloster clostridioformis]MDB2142429.1 hypothetical protein [Enterocloster clostridioformis]MDB2149307.1 hypothetical protein [Enterocloster clostridioformis]NSJ12472.1 hypothetical protein [Enterocloster clostridioformis]NSJ33192.1 hypothetical protein [Enterocloster clostridioformis]NSJ61705.1 hypothetical protein [Enterocloster clostridioformis]
MEGASALDFAGQKGELFVGLYLSQTGLYQSCGLIMKLRSSLTEQSHFCRRISGQWRLSAGEWGDDSYFLMCGGLYDPIIGLVDGQRMVADVLSMWRSGINRDGKSQPFTVKQNMLRYYMNHWWNNDPDALMVRRRREMERELRLTLGLLNEEEVKTAVVNRYLGGGLVCSTEPLASIDDDRLYQLEHILPVMERQVEVRNLFGGGRFPDIADIYLPEKERHSFVLINWNDEKEMPADFQLAEKTVSGLKKDQAYLAAEFYSGCYRTDIKYGDTVYMGVIRSHGSAVFKIQEYDPARPFIVGSMRQRSGRKTGRVSGMGNPQKVFGKKL